jgi:hypothetical protein
VKILKHYKPNSCDTYSLFIYCIHYVSKKVSLALACLKVPTFITMSVPPKKQYPESNCNNIWSLTSSLRLRQLVLILPDLLVMSILLLPFSLPENCCSMITYNQRRYRPVLPLLQSLLLFVFQMNLCFTVHYQ